MNLLSVSKLSRHGRTAPLFEDVTFGLDEGEKIALIGRNGSGKSTLLACVAGTLAPDAGKVTVNREAGVSFLPQTPTFRPGSSILDHVFGSESPSLSLIRSYETACDGLARASGDRAATLASQRLEECARLMDERDLWNYEARVKSILAKLSITDLSLPMETLSGGMLKKVALAQVLVEDTKVLLLDEPTNHLDIATIAWLEGYLRDTDRSVLMVTHDRYFLDAVCTSIHEIDGRKLKRYEGNFSRYLEKKAIEEEILERTEARIESVLRTEREWLLRGPQARGTKAKARIQAIERLEGRERREDGAAFEFEVTGRRLGGKILEASGVGKTWTREGNSRRVLSGFSWKFRKGERIGVFGDNGSGKTTLLNILSGALEPDEGTVSLGANTVIGYYRQNPDIPNLGMTPLEYIEESATVIERAQGGELSAPLLLERFGIAGPMQYSPLSALSGGERKRVYLVRLLISNPNFLILDEPTNDFDIYTMGVLESFLSAYEGCLLIVSHDRFFMDRVAETLFVLDGSGEVLPFPVSCSEYLAYREEKAAEEERAAREEATRAREKAPDRSEKKAKRSFKEEREYAENRGQDLDARGPKGRA
jgi:ATP-binding cassette subfamily F protein uup